MEAATITACMILAALTRMYPSHQDVPQVQAEIGKVIQHVEKQCEAEKKKAGKTGK